jgi:hypothetical protein
MALLTLKAVGTSVTPRLAAKVFCRVAGWRPMVVVTAKVNGSLVRGNSCCVFQQRYREQRC